MHTSRDQDISWISPERFSFLREIGRPPVNIREKCRTIICKATL
jgi:hypothetical protein